MTSPSLCFFMLAAAIASLLVPTRHPKTNHIVSALLVIISIGLGIFDGVIRAIGLILLIVAAVAFSLAKKVVLFDRGSDIGRARFIAIMQLLGLMLCLMIGLRVIPGAFTNQLIVPSTRLSSDSREFVQYFNFDKGVAGFLLLFFLIPQARLGEWWRGVRYGVLGASAAFVLLASLALSSGLLSLDPKLPVFTGYFLFANFFFTCVAEEALFRGVLQEQVHRWCDRRGRSMWVNVVAISVLSLAFALVHPIGSLAMFAFTAIAGWAYGMVYYLTRRIEASILLHFLVNAGHFFFFSYPGLKS
jgi:uncharacterized protein